ncbi:unnamed protein product [Trichobilharzia szidati]|nr:unnamed protein product [Trichobilharzia szidati]CAH8851783.1 unnamed protein product [Trichobilharzia szidati]
MGLCDATGTLKCTGKQMSERYTRGKTLGSGTYGKVYLATDRMSGERYAIKKVMMFGSGKSIHASTIREVGIMLELNNLNCDNIVRIHEILHSKSQIYIVYELADWDLKDFIQRFADVTLENNLPCQRLPSEIAKSFATQILDGLIVCHKHRVIHRDLKPSNILITIHGIVKIADFGLSRTTSIPHRTLSQEVITLWYRAPEILLGIEKYSHSIDIWSFGCILYEMV